MSLTTIIFAKLKSIVQSLIPAGRRRLERNYSGYKALHSIQQTNLTDDFDSIYNSALFDFENSSIKHPQLINLFSKDATKSAFKKDYYSGSSNEMFDSMDADLHLQPQYSVLNDSNISLQSEIDEFVQKFIVKLNDVKSPLQKETSEQLNELKSLIVSGLEISKENFDLSEYISQINSLRKENKHNAVLQLLQNFKSERWGTLSNALKYKITLNIGYTLFELDKKKEGSNYFIQLLDFNVNIPEATGLVALGYSLLDQHEKAINIAEKALNLNPQNENAYLALIFSKRFDDLSSLNSLIPANIQEHPSISINIGSILEKLNEPEKAFEIFEKLLLGHRERDAFRCDILLTTATNRLRSICHPEDYLFDQLSEGSISKIVYAQEKLNEAWMIVKDTDLRVSRSYILTNIGVTHKFLSQPAEAENNFKISIAINPTYFSCRHLLLMNTENKDKYQEVLQKIEKLDLSTSEKQEVLLFKVQNQLEHEKSENVIGELIDQIPSINSRDLKIEYYGSICEIFTITGELEEAEKYANILLNDFPNDPYGHLCLYHIYKKRDDSVQSHQHLLAAKKLIDTDTGHVIGMQLAEIFLRNEEYASAQEVLEKMADVNLASKITKKLLFAYYKGGIFKKAVDLLEILISRYPSDSFLIDMLSAIYEHNSQFEQAIAIINGYLKSNPNDKLMRYKLSMNYYKISQYKKATECLDAITDYSDISLDMQFLIADAYIKSGEMNKGCEIAYQVRNTSYSLPNVHARYIQILTTAPELPREAYFPGVVSIDCYVSLVDEAGKTQEFILVETPKIQNEISISEPLAKELIGKGVGDEVIFGDTVYTINSIVSKFTHGMHNSMEMLETRFRDQTAIKVMRLIPNGTPEENLARILEPLHNRESLDEQIDHLYLTGQTTIGVNAKISGMSPIKYWQKLVSNADIRIAALGSLEEAQEGIESLEAKTAVIFDITSLLALFELDAIQLLNRIPNRKLVTPSTIELLRSEIDELSERIDNDSMSIVKSGGKYIKMNITSEEKKATILSLGKFRSIILEQAEIIGPTIDDEFYEKQKKDALLGKSFNETAIVAKEITALIISDDVFFRQLAKNEYGVKGIASLTLLDYARLNELVTGNTFEEYLCKYIKLNYRSIPVNENVLLKLCEESKYQIQPPFTIACEIVDPSVLDNFQAIKLVGQFILALYRNITFPQTRLTILQYVLSKLFHGRNHASVKMILIPFIDKLFVLLPINKDEITQIIQMQF